MANPVTGPITTNGSRSGHGPGSYSWYKVNYKQAKPYNLTTPYVNFLRVCLGTNYALSLPDDGSASSGNWTAGGTRLIGVGDGEFYDARNKAHKKLRGNITNRAEWLVNIAQRKQAIDMIAGRAVQLLRFARAAKRFDLKGAAAALSVPKTTKRRFKSAGDVWLEYHFGWSPLLSDISSSIDILQQPVQSKKVHGYGSSTTNMYFSETFPGNRRIVTTRSFRTTVWTGCFVEVTNPNLWLANQLGLVNPATIAWELVPFSFVVDWFIPVNAFLSSFTEDFGLALTQSFTSGLGIECIQYTRFSLHPGIPYGSCTNQATTFERVNGLLDPKLRAPSLGRLSITRAASAIALLLQQIK